MYVCFGTMYSCLRPLMNTIFSIRRIDTPAFFPKSEPLSLPALFKIRTHLRNAYLDISLNGNFDKSIPEYGFNDINLLLIQT